MVSADVLLKASAAASLLFYACLILVGERKQRAYVFLAIFLLLVAGNQTMEAIRGLYPRGSFGDILFWRLATVFASLDPTFFLLFGAAYAGWSGRGKDRVLWTALACSAVLALLAIFAWSSSSPITSAFVGNPTPFEAAATDIENPALTTFTAVVYLSVLVAALTPPRRQGAAEGALWLGIALIALPAIDRAVGNDAVYGHWAIGLGIGSIPLLDQILVDGAIVAAVLALAWSKARGTAFRAQLVPYATIAVVATAILALYNPIAVALLPGAPGIYVANVFGKALAPIRFLAFSSLVSIAVVRDDLLGLSMRSRRIAAHVILGFLAFAGAALILEAARTEGVYPSSVSPIDVVLIGTVVILSQTTRTLLDRTAAVLFAVPSRRDEASSIETFRRALAAASRRAGNADAEADLERLRRELGISRPVAHALRDSAPAPTFAVGDLLADRYQMVESISSRAGARVFLTRDRILARDVILKELPSAESASALTEARVGGGLSHPNIVTVYDVVPVGRTSFLAMEYAPGGSLQARIDRGAPPLAEALALLSGILEGLATLHDHGVVHCDLKPANVLLTRDAVPKISDFGLARIQRGLTIGYEEVHAFAGTPDYMAPEQRRGFRATPAADVYAAGLVARQLLPGDAPAGIRAVVEKALAADPEERYPNARAFLRAFQIATPEATQSVPVRARTAPTEGRGTETTPSGNA